MGGSKRTHIASLYNETRIVLLLLRVWVGRASKKKQNLKEGGTAKSIPLPDIVRQLSLVPHKNISSKKISF